MLHGHFCMEIVNGMADGVIWVEPQLFTDFMAINVWCKGALKCVTFMHTLHIRMCISVDHTSAE